MLSDDSEEGKSPRYIHEVKEEATGKMAKALGERSSRRMQPETALLLCHYRKMSKEGKSVE
jgi:hypothetical protein